MKIELVLLNFFIYKSEISELVKMLKSAIYFLAFKIKLYTNYAGRHFENSCALIIFFNPASFYKCLRLTYIGFNSFFLLNRNKNHCSVFNVNDCMGTIEIDDDDDDEENVQCCHKQSNEWGVNDRESFWDDNDDGDHTRNDYLQMKTPNNADNRITLFQLSAVMF